MTTPVLFLIFNRPAQTKRVFEALKMARPERLFVAADGPRAGRKNEEALCREARSIATAVDWKCEVSTLFHDSNLGCGKAVSGAISWFFEQVEEGIILEDDCLPHRDFFSFCSLMLERYRDDERIATVGGTHCLPSKLRMNSSYYASKYFQMWGWASWRRFWRHYDYGLSALAGQQWSQLLDGIHPNKLEARFWGQIYKSLKDGGIDTWDFQAFFAAWRVGAVHLMPSLNLVSNLGYGADATHTNFASPMSELPVSSLRVDDALPSVVPDPQVDELIYFVRYLDSLRHSYWLEQIVSPEDCLAEARNELSRTNRKLRLCENELLEKRRQLRDAVNALRLPNSLD